MQRQVIHITNFDEPLPTPTRRVGVVNFGVYCQCGEFIALLVSEPRQPPLNVEFVAEKPVLIKCPYCQSDQRRQVHQILRVPLTEKNRRQLDRHFRQAAPTQSRALR